MLEAAHVHDTEARILDAAVRSRSTATRSEIASQLGLTASAVTRAVDGMVKSEILEEETVERDGRSRRELRVRPDAACFAGVTVQKEDDDHPGIVRAAAVNLAGQQVGDEVEMPLPSSQWGVVTDVAAEAIGKVQAEYGPLTAAGVAIGGHVDSREGIVHYSPNLGWESAEVRLGKYVNHQTGLFVVVENDANSLCLFDRLYAEGRCDPWFASVLVGRGVGLGLFAGTTVITGRSGRAGELGHVWAAEENECRCGKVGCLEAQIGSSHLLDRLHRSPATKRKMQGVKKMRDVAKLADACPEGPVADEIRRCATYLGRALANMCNLADVNTIVIRHTGLLDSDVFNTQLGEVMNERLFTPEAVRLAAPMRLLPSDVIRGAAAASLFRVLRDHGVKGLRPAELS